MRHFRHGTRRSASSDGTQSSWSRHSSPPRSCTPAGLMSTVIHEGLRKKANPSSMIGVERIVSEREAHDTAGTLKIRTIIAGMKAQRRDVISTQTQR